MIARSKRDGYVLIMTCLALLVIAGFAGLAVDVGRMYIVKSELQSLADSAALTASLQLDGTSAGIVRAQLAAGSVLSGANALKWDMDTRTVSDLTTSFARGLSAAPNSPDDATWSANPADASYYRFTRVVARVALPLSFMGAFHAYSSGKNMDESPIAASSVAGQTMVTNLPATYPDANTVQARITEDSDQKSPDYATYLKMGRGNGRRVVGLAGGAFFVKSGEVERIGPFVQGSLYPGAGADTLGDTGVYVVRLVE
ncbi:MAG: pilus assembly protein TadG-related protein [Bryobacteraceae bacterium]